MVMEDQIPGAQSSLPDHLARWRADARLRHVIGAEIAALILIVALPWSRWWVAVIFAAVTLLVATITYNGATAVGWLTRAARFLWFGHRRTAAARRAAIPAAFNVDLSGIGPLGMRWDGQYAVTMIALHGHAYAPTFLDPSGAQTEDMAPLRVVSSLLQQFGGLELACVDVVSTGRRTVESSRFSATYDESVGDRPAVGLRHTWLVLRLCPQACLAALAYRGDAAAAAAAATERIRQAVLRAGCRAVTCTKEQMAAATDVLLGGVALTEVRELWSRVDAGGDYVTTYRVAGRDLNTDWVNDVWAVRSRLTVLTTRLAATASGTVMVSAVVRFHTAQQLTHPPVLALQPVSGQAFAALAASLPLGNRALALQMSARRLDAAPLDIPVTPAGFMIGTTTFGGFPLLLPLADPLRVTRMQLAVELEVVQALMLRATATGATVLVHTTRPEAWAPIRSEHIWLEDPGAEHAVITTVVLDGDDIEMPTMAVGERGHAVVSVTSTPSADADVSIVQTSPGDLLLSTPRVSNVELRVLRPRNEAQFLAHLRRPAPVAP
ncbi:MAG: type VII secretion protein EccE [Mycolicibacterium sp.]|nr:type VII secretion protein EccE [Mycolicibacterium sp.]